MMIRSAAVAVLLLVTAPACKAESIYDVTVNLASLLASEELCGLSFKAAALEAYVNERVPADDLSFINKLELNTSVSRSDFTAYPPSQKIVHCAQVRRSAKHYGFID